MGRHHHVTRELLLAARRGHITERELSEVLLDRLAVHCPDCRRAIERFVADEIPQELYREAVAHALQMDQNLREHEREHELATELRAQLEPHSLEQRLLRIRNTPERFGQPILGELLLDAARSCLPHDPRGSLSWARTLEAVADVYPEPYEAHRVLAIAYEGNAHRALGDFHLAQVLLSRAWELMRHHRITEVDVGADLRSLLGSLCSDLSRFDEAAEHLEAAVASYRSLGDTKRLARSLLKLGLLHALLDDLPAALHADREAMSYLHPEEDLQLYLAGRLNYALHKTDAGDPVAGRDLIDCDIELYEEHADSHTLTRVRWLQARLASTLGPQEEAEAGYRKVRDAFAAEAHGFNAALVSLDLAQLYFDQGRMDDVEEVADQAVRLFEAHEIHREALAALLMLRDAAQARAVTAETIARIATFLRHAEHDPTARLQAAN